MDRTLSALERAWRDARDVDAARELARLRLRAGRPLAALTLARVSDDAALRRDAAEAFARSLELDLLELGVTEVFGRGDRPLVLIPGGRFLEETVPRAETSLLTPGGGQRTPLAPVYVPDLLVGREPRPALDPHLAHASARASGGRLLSPTEWKKSWRGGLFLDGDETEQRPNPCPDRLAPWTESGATSHSAYGLRFRDGQWEHTQAGQVAMGYNAGRYQVSVSTPAERRGRHLVWRLVIDPAGA